MNADEIDHRAIIASLSASDRARADRADQPRRHLSRFAFHFGAILLLGAAILCRVPLWPLLLPLQGILIIFLFTAMHETIHGTAFRSAWLNRARRDRLRLPHLHPAGVVPLFPFRASSPHARSRQRSGADEPQAGDGRAICALSLRAAAVDRHGQGDRRQCAGHRRRALRPRKGQGQGAARGARSPLPPMRRSPCFVALWSPALLWAWIVPILFGQPFLRAYLLAEHARCPHVANMLENTRTTFTTALVRLDRLEHAVPCRAPRLSGGAVPQAAALSRDRARASEDDRARLCPLQPQVRRRVCA